MISLTDIHVLLLRQLSEKPLSRGARVPDFCQDLEAESYVEMTADRRDLVVKITAKGKRALADAEARSPEVRCSTINDVDGLPDRPDLT